MKDNLLEVGDVLYIPKRYTSGYERKVTVERVTNTQAILSMGGKVYRAISKDGTVKKVGYSSYGVNYYEIASKEVIEKAELNLMRGDVKSLLNSINHKLLNKKQCEAVINLLSPLKDLSKN